VLNRLAWRLDPLNGTTGFTYDAKGNLLSVTDARSNATTYACVNMDRLATRVDLLMRSESYQYECGWRHDAAHGQKKQGDKSVGGRQIFYRLSLLIALRGEFDLDLGAEGAGDLLGVGKDTRS